ncbi:hypothetical protein NVP2117O_38 [Vibrio phage 2.117.O._10N.261.45.E9]|nr:hypothetical protein NVP1117O_38 [Vibrio phage 1.117.O._10N.261.45.E9]AUR95439.1 hypothetical protein NVP1207B_32 [Vibrio phage 1.207.B._10N.222.51.C2]AUS02330.1 hypothetical protein NVP2117O_38 [Vibrio phage 2.117.O._10N.261.45.E9]
MDMTKFYTRDSAEKGIKLPLILPNGEKTDEYLVVLGVDSDTFRKANTVAIRSSANVRMTMPKATEEELAAAQDEIELELIATLVTDWSFETECTKANVIEFLRNAPQLRDAVNIKAASRAAFFEKGATN